MRCKVTLCVCESLIPLSFWQFINLGAVNGDPSTQDCNRYAGLFQSSAILHSPGVPDAYGTAAIVQACQNDMALVCV